MPPRRRSPTTASRSRRCRTFTYDAAYRLIEATGREHIGQTALDFNPVNDDRRDYPFAGTHANPNDPQALRAYTERYRYDLAGNIEEMRHIATGGGWTRSYLYDEASLLDGGREGQPPHPDHGRQRQRGRRNLHLRSTPWANDVHGCIAAVNAMAMAWDSKDQLRQVDLGGGGTAWYVYDAAGQRTRKVIASQNGTRRKERISLGDFEVYREYGANGLAVALERESLHVMDAQRRVALVETLTDGERQSRQPRPCRFSGYQVANHQGASRHRARRRRRADLVRGVRALWRDLLPGRPQRRRGESQALSLHRQGARRRNRLHLSRRPLLCPGSGVGPRPTPGRRSAPIPMRMPYNAVATIRSGSTAGEIYRRCRRRAARPRGVVRTDQFPRDAAATVIHGADAAYARLKRRDSSGGRRGHPQPQNRRVMPGPAKPGRRQPLVDNTGRPGEHRPRATSRAIRACVVQGPAGVAGEGDDEAGGPRLHPAGSKRRPTTPAARSPTRATA